MVKILSEDIPINKVIKCEAACIFYNALIAQLDRATDF